MYFAFEIHFMYLYFIFQAKIQNAKSLVGNMMYCISKQAPRQLSPLIPHRNGLSDGSFEKLLLLHQNNLLKFAEH